MDQFVEYASSEDSNGYDVSNTSEKEAALYSLVHHSYDAYESNDLKSFDSESYPVNITSQVSRWKLVQPTHSSSSANLSQFPNFADHKEHDFMPLADTNSVNNTYFNEMEKKVCDTSGRRNNGRKMMNPNNRTKNYISNLVSIDLDFRKDSLKKKARLQSNINALTAQTNQNPNPKFSVCRFAQKNAKGVSPFRGMKSIPEVGRQDKDSNNDIIFCSPIKSADKMKTFKESLNVIPESQENFSNNDKRQKLHTLSTEDDHNTTNGSVSIKIVECVSNSNKEKNNPENFQEILIISDSEDDNSIEVLPPPPKPEPPVIALDSSDEILSATDISTKPLINVVPPEMKIVIIPELPTLCSSQEQDNSCFDKSVTLTNNNSRQSKKKKKKKKIKTVTSMVEFYNESWGGETFDHVKMQKNMSNNPQLWQILDVDKYGPPRNHGPRVRCNNCNQIGHFERDCNVPKKIIRCFMCGQQGHSEFRCPSKICLKCGRPASLFNSGCPSCWSKDHPANCETCGDREHFSWMCPNVWRKFHAVTSSEELNDTKLQVQLFKPSVQLRCCFCAGLFHTVTECPFFSRYGQNRSNTSVTSYRTPPRGMKRKKKTNSSFEWRNVREFYRKRRKTN